MAFDKLAWQRDLRARFKAEHGYSQRCEYGAGKLREAVLKRDRYACVRCGMTDVEHKSKWGRPITVDHIDKNRKHNTLDNLQTLCLHCHGQKDQSTQLRRQLVCKFKSQIIGARASGETYQAIADKLGFSIAAIWKWCKRWEIA